MAGQAKVVCKIANDGACVVIEQSDSTISASGVASVDDDDYRSNSLLVLSEPKKKLPGLQRTAEQVHEGLEKRCKVMVINERLFVTGSLIKLKEKTSQGIAGERGRKQNQAGGRRGICRNLWRSVRSTHRLSSAGWCIN